MSYTLFRGLWWIHIWLTCVNNLYFPKYCIALYFKNLTYILYVIRISVWILYNINLQESFNMNLYFSFSRNSYTYLNLRYVLNGQNISNHFFFIKSLHTSSQYLHRSFRRLSFHMIIWILEDICRTNSPKLSVVFLFF